MNIQQLEYLIAVDKYKHFGKAAQSCFITQPTLSAMIQKFEDELNVKIFDRTTHPIRTTDIGLQIIDQARVIINSVYELKNKADSLNNIIGGTFVLGIIPTVSTYLLPKEIFNFLKKNPKVELSVKEMTTDSIITALKAGELDAGIISTPYSAADEFYHDKLFNEELMIYTSESNEEHQYIAPENISSDRVWLLEEGNCLRKQFENICHLKENELKPKNLDFQASNINTLVQIVDSLGGITILPELAAEQLSTEQKSKIAKFKNPYPYREITLVYYKPTYKQRIIDELISEVKISTQRILNFYKSPDDYVNVIPQ